MRLPSRMGTMTLRSMIAADSSCFSTASRCATSAACGSGPWAARPAGTKSDRESASQARRRRAARHPRLRCMTCLQRGCGRGDGTAGYTDCQAKNAAQPRGAGSAPNASGFRRALARRRRNGSRRRVARARDGRPTGYNILDNTVSDTVYDPAFQARLRPFASSPRVAANHPQEIRSMRRSSTLLAAFLACLCTTVASAQRSVTGHVLEEGTKQPVAGAQISILGTLTGALADDAGQFTVRVPSGPVTLSARRIGYKRKDVPLPANQDTVTIILTRDVLNLEQVIVTGQATGIERRNLANAVSVVNGADLNRVQSQTIESALQGKVAGANISANSGAPGGGLQIQLRGTTSIIGNSEPLYVIDGVPATNAAVPGGTNAITGASSGISSDEDNAANRLADLNPNDIQTIEILKGAAASANYGSQASNGVVLITTKRGTPGKTRLDITQQVGVTEVSNLLGM